MRVGRGGDRGRIYVWYHSRPRFALMNRGETVAISSLRAVVNERSSNMVISSIEIVVHS